MYRGTLNAVAKVWNAPGGQQIDELRSGTVVLGSPPRSDGLVLLSSPVAGYTKKTWITDYKEVTDPEPTPDPIPPGRVLKHTIRIFNDGSIQIDGGDVIP